jgi:hypothetical protein
LPGTAVAACLSFRRQLDAATFACLAMVGSGATGYAAFWAYWLSPRSGKAFSCIVLLCSLGVLAYTFGTHRLPARLLRQLAIAAGLAAMVAIFYSGLTWMYRYSEQPLTEAAHRYYDLPFDNGLPYLFADHLLRHLPVTPNLIYGWQSSDRPPLQTGIVLLQFPLWTASAREWWYQGLATFLQATWISAVWVFMCAANFPRRTMAVVLGFCLVSPFFLLHTIFVWPKLLSAAFFIIGLTLLRFAIPDAKPEAFAVTLSAVAMALALLSHAGIAFSLIALCLLLVATRSLPPLKTVAPAALVALVFLLPWTLYQKLYDPPGNRLLKWHLAGAVDLDSRSFGRALVDAYSKTPPSTILHNRIANLAMLVGDEPLRQFAGIATGHSRPNSQALVATYINGVFLHVFQALGVLDVGLLGFLFARFASREKFDRLGAIVERLLLLASTSILIWCALIAIPGGTLVHVASFGDITILFVACAASLAHFVPKLASALFVFQALVAFPLFVFSARLLHSAPDAVWAGSFDPGMAALSLAAVVAFGALAQQLLYGRPPRSPMDAISDAARAVSSNASGLR